MAGWNVSIGFTEALGGEGIPHGAEAIKNLCAWAGLPAKAPYVGDATSEVNAKAVLKRLAVQTIKQQQVVAAREAAEAQPDPT